MIEVVCVGVKVLFDLNVWFEMLSFCLMCVVFDEMFVVCYLFLLSEVDLLFFCGL